MHVKSMSRCSFGVLAVAAVHSTLTDAAYGQLEASSFADASCTRIRVSQESSPGADDFDLNVLGCIDVFQTMGTAAQYYQYNVGFPASFNGPAPLLESNRSHLFLVAGTDGLSLFIVHDKPNTPPGGRAEMYFELLGDPNGAARTVEDDPNDAYIPAVFPATLFASRHSWVTCCTDGLVLTGLDGDWSMLVEFSEFVDDPGPAVIEGLDDGWFAYSADGSTIELALEVDRRVRLDCCEECPSLDIKPGSCPNSFNRNSHGMLPVALVGTESFDLMEVDLATIQLSRADGVGGSVAPNEGPPGPHSTFEDVATPFEGELCDCHDLEGDGITDLLMKFRTDDVVAALLLNDLPAGDLVELVVSGALLDGTEFSASDCIRLVPPAYRQNIRATRNQ